MIAFLAVPLGTLASQQSGQYYPPTNSDYYLKKFSWQLYTSQGVSQIRFTQYDLNNVKKGQLVLKVKDKSNTWVDFNCKGNVHIQFQDKKGKTLDFSTRGPATSYLNNSKCNYKSFVSFSNYDSSKKKYKDDTFHAKQNKKGKSK
jgi:hypothetical protein